MFDTDVITLYTLENSPSRSITITRVANLCVLMNPHRRGTLSSCAAHAPDMRRLGAQMHMQDMEEDVNCVLFALKNAAPIGAPAEVQAQLKRMVTADASLMEELQDMLSNMRVVDTAR